MLKFLPAEIRDIAVGATVLIKHDDHLKQPDVEGKVIERELKRNGNLYFTVARAIDRKTVHFCLHDYAPFTVRALADTEQRCKRLMRSLKARAESVPSLSAPRALKGGPFNGEQYAARTHAGDTLVFTCNGMTGSYRDYTWVPA